MFKNLSWANSAEELDKKNFLGEGTKESLSNFTGWPRISSAPASSFRPSYWEKIENDLIRQAKEKALFIEKEAYEKGFAQGEKNGWEMAQKKLTVLWDNFQKLFQELAKKTEQLYEQQEEELIKLSLEITRKILKQNHPALEETIIKTLAAAWQYIKDHKKIIIHLHPKDYEYLMANSSSCPFLHSEKKLGKIEMVADPTITRGGCYLRTAVGDIDATLETQFDQLVSLIWQQVTEKKG